MNNITIIGIGKLGLGFALLCEKSGFNIVGVDINSNYVESLNNKTFKTK
jgi:UDP-N-acetyl-D-mannosaminuronate dehydrogenase